MGAALSRRLGLTATWRVMQALGERQQAPDVRSESRYTPAPTGVSRRRFLQGLAGGLVAVSVLPASQALAANRGIDGVSRALPVPASSAVIDRLKRFKAVRRASGTFGRPDWNGVTQVTYRDRGRERTGFSIPYEGTDAVAGATFLFAEDEGKLRDAHSIVTRVREGSDGDADLAYYLVDGTPLAVVEEVDGEIRTKSAREANLQAVGEPRAIPGPGDFAACFALCLGFSVSGVCRSYCIRAVIGPNRRRNARRCGACAGPAGVRCAIRCSPLLP